MMDLAICYEPQIPTCMTNLIFITIGRTFWISAPFRVGKFYDITISYANNLNNK